MRVVDIDAVSAHRGEGEREREREREKSFRIAVL